MDKAVHRQAVHGEAVHGQAVLGLDGVVRRLAGVRAHLGAGGGEQRRENQGGGARPPGEIGEHDYLFCSGCASGRSPDPAAFADAQLRNLLELGKKPFSRIG
jgi:hypothetical protein